MRQAQASGERHLIGCSAPSHLAMRPSDMARPRPTPRSAALEDPSLPMSTMLGGAARGLLAAAVGAGGAELRSAMPRQASYEPGRSLTVRYDTVRWPSGLVAQEMLVATTRRSLHAGALVLDDGDHQVAVWRVPHDPALPGLAAALDPDRARLLLAELGAPVVSATPRLRAYRPGRRAVVEVSAPGARLYLKVVRPVAAHDLHRRHVLLANQVPVPRSLGWSPELGLVALQAVAGRTLRCALDQRRGLPGGAGLIDLLDRLPDPGALAGSGSGWQSARFAGVIRAVAPCLAGQVDALAGELGAAEVSLDEALVPSHGDFHEAQLMVDGGRITGLLDVDTFGPGRRLDDLATLIGHLATLAVGSPRRSTIERYAARLLEHFERTVDPARLRYAVAAVVLGLATGPFRVLEPGWRAATARRVALSEQWLASATRLAPSPVAR